jgi:protein TonB
MIPSTHLASGLRLRFALLAASVLHVGMAVAVGHAHASVSSPELSAALVEVPAPEIETVEAPPVPDVAIIEPSRAASPPPRSVARSKPAALPDTPAIGAPQIIAVPPPGPLRFVMTAAPVIPTAYGALGGSTASPTAPSPSDAPSGDAVTVGEASVDAKPALLSGSVPVYPVDAARDGIESDVRLEIVLDTTGAVIDARPLAHVGHGLDDAALRAVRTYRFSRGLRHGRPVRVRMAWTVMFRLD